nr:hypothetical protein BaRGS_029707 [Batillaria attramentaria]
MSHIRTIPVAKDKVPPAVADSTGKQSVHASASLSVASVISVDDVQQTVTTVNYFRLYWQDKSLAWNESDYDGIQFLELPVNSIWTPSVNVINSMDNTEAFGLSSDVVISSDGSLHVRSYFITETFCGMDLSRYPFDEQNCPMVLLSFSKFLNLVISDDATGKAVAAMFSVSAEWDLLSTSAVPFYLEEYNVNGTVVMIKFRRKTTFYTVCLVLPMALTSYMNTLVFLVPLQSGEKVSFLVSIFVSTSVYVSFKRWVCIKLKVTLNASIAVVSVLDVDDAEQTVRTANYLQVYWQDKSLAWNALDYSGVQSLEVPVGTLWMPTIYVINSLELENVLSMDRAVVVSSDGSVYARAYFITDTICRMDLTYYPFDEQNCPMVLGSFSKFVAWSVDDDPKARAAASGFSPGAEWDLLKTSATVTYVNEYDEEGALITMRFRRKTAFYTVCLVLPMALTSYMNTLVFLVPLQSGEKVSFLVTIFVSTSVFVRLFRYQQQQLRDSDQQATNGSVTKKTKLQPEESETAVTNRAKHTSTHSPDVTRSPDAPEGARDVSDVKQVKVKSDTLRAECLDRLFFILAFVGNTTFLTALLYTSLSCSAPTSDSSAM